MKKIEEIIKNTNDVDQEKIDWTNAWSDRYPILNKYQKEVDILKYSSLISSLLQELQNEYGYSRQDAMLVLKDILYHIYKEK